MDLKKAEALAMERSKVSIHSAMIEEKIVWGLNHTDVSQKAAQGEGRHAGRHGPVVTKVVITLMSEPTDNAKLLQAAEMELTGSGNELNNIDPSKVGSKEKGRRPKE